MELVHVDVVSLEQAQAGLQILPEALHSGGRGLGGDDDVPPHAGKGQAHFLLAVGVGTGGVEIGDAGVVGFAQEHPGVVGGDTLDGQSAKAVLVHSDAGAAQGDSLHTSTSFLKKIEGKTGHSREGESFAAPRPGGTASKRDRLFQNATPEKAVQPHKIVGKQGQISAFSGLFLAVCGDGGAVRFPSGKGVAGGHCFPRFSSARLRRS